jgi:endonuclease G
MKRSLLFILSIALQLIGFAQDFSTIKNLELPRFKQGETVVQHAGYTLSYNETHEQANWVAYELTAFETKKVVDRTNRFMEDPKIATGSASLDDYRNSGYDRGHLAPAADLGWSMQSMEESFYMSNMSPQLPAFNRGIWGEAEAFTRKAAKENGSLFVVSGPIFSANMKTIGVNRVAVPERYYKILLDVRDPELKALAFIIPNRDCSEELEKFVVSIDEIETATGIDFFPALPDEWESKLEASRSITNWPFGTVARRKAVYDQPSTKHSSGESVQCSGRTQAGKRCKRMTKDPNGRCASHGG